MKKIYFLLTISVFFGNIANSQAPNPALVGYWHNWNTSSAPYIQLDQVDTNYNIIDLAFALPKTGTDYDMEFTPTQVTSAVLISQIQTLQTKGKKVIISMGGATAAISLDNFAERDTFISSMNTIINTYGFDGIDIDFEGSSVSVSGGTISAPTDPKIINLIYAIKKIMSDYYSANGKHLILTMAPETAFVQGGMSAYGGIWGAYLPVIDALRDSLDLLHVQLYNSGSMYGIDGNIYTQGNADFIIAMTEAVIQGFSTSGGMFNGLPASKVAVGLPACSSSAGGGYTDTAIVKSAIEYVIGTGTKPGSYSLAKTTGHPTLRGMMTWSINWDAVSSCNGANSFLKNYKSIFGNSSTTSISNIEITNSNFVIFPNPSENYIQIETSVLTEKRETAVLFNSIGKIQFSQEISMVNQIIKTSDLKPGIYFVRYRNNLKRFIKI